mmetsp:Transcript_21964/g.66776  ORF Transcript_21964/g.66776 Transcript_21964/m.66776 type:complete len:249 (+) Transcript_21964:687-1433(+)
MAPESAVHLPSEPCLLLLRQERRLATDVGQLPHLCEALYGFPRWDRYQEGSRTSAKTCERATHHNRWSAALLRGPRAWSEVERRRSGCPVLPRHSRTALRDSEGRAPGPAQAVCPGQHAHGREARLVQSGRLRRSLHRRERRLHWANMRQDHSAHRIIMRRADPGTRRRGSTRCREAARDAAAVAIAAAHLVPGRRSLSRPRSLVARARGGRRGVPHRGPMCSHAPPRSPSPHSLSSSRAAAQLHGWH